MKNRKLSAAAFGEALQCIPGGVNSPVRAYRSVAVTPVIASSASGAVLTDIDGYDYVDYIGSWGPMILGHAHPEIVASMQIALRKGTSFGTPTELETEMAKLIIDRLPSIEMVRMVNSGTEATMSAIRLARGFTRRSKIVKFEGGYHGHADAMLIKAGSGVATLGLPDSPGVPTSIAAETITVPYNDEAAVTAVFEKYGDEIAAVIVEPVSGNMGVVPPTPTFLPHLRQVTKQYESLLIFDEVMTGFRVHYASAQGLYQIDPDLTCLGKVIGGGLPVGAYGGKREIMEMVAPSGPVYQAGTLSGNPLAMTAGYETLRRLTPEVYELLEHKSAMLEQGFRENGKRIGMNYCIHRVGSMLCPFFTEQHVTNYQTAASSDLERFKYYYQFMLEAGVLLPPSQFEGMFISLAHQEEQLEHTILSHRQALEAIHKQT